MWVRRVVSDFCECKPISLRVRNSHDAQLSNDNPRCLEQSSLVIDQWAAMAVVRLLFGVGSFLFGILAHSAASERECTAVGV